MEKKKRDWRMFFKGRINYFLRKHDYNIYRISHKRDTMFGAVKNLSEVGFSPATVIDIGAAFGDWTETAMRFFPSAFFYAVEPQKEYFPQLSKLPIKKIFNCVLGERAGTVVFNIHKDWFSSSVFAQPDDQYTIREKREVEQKTLDDIASDLPGPFLIKMDAEGAELTILKGGLKSIEKTNIIILEVLLIPFSKETPRLDEIIDYLREIGFLAYDIVDTQYRVTDGALRKVDIVFIRKEHPILKDLNILSPEKYAEYNQMYSDFNQRRASSASIRIVD